MDEPNKTWKTIWASFVAQVWSEEDGTSNGLLTRLKNKDASVHAVLRQRLKDAGYKELPGLKIKFKPPPSPPTVEEEVAYDYDSGEIISYKKGKVKQFNNPPNKSDTVDSVVIESRNGWRNHIQDLAGKVILKLPPKPPNKKDYAKLLNEYTTIKAGNPFAGD